MKVTDLGKGGRTFPGQLHQGRRDHVRHDRVRREVPHPQRSFHRGGRHQQGDLRRSDVERGLGQKKIELNEEAEVVSLLGSITTDAQGRANVHAHGSVALSDGSVKGGHWWEAHISIIAEVFVTEEEAAAEPTK